MSSHDQGTELASLFRQMLVKELCFKNKCVISKAEWVSSIGRQWEGSVNGRQVGFLPTLSPPTKEVYRPLFRNISLPVLTLYTFIIQDGGITSRHSASMPSKMRLLCRQKHGQCMLLIKCQSGNCMGQLIFFFPHCSRFDLVTECFHCVYNMPASFSSLCRPFNASSKLFRHCREVHLTGLPRSIAQHQRSK